MIKKIVLAVIVIGLTSGLAGAADRSNNTTPSNAATPSAGNKIRQDMLVLDDKGDDYVMFCNRIFEVSSYTTIRNERGTIISLEALSIPCEAMVSYYKNRKENNRYVAVTIEVQGEATPVPE